MGEVRELHFSVGENFGDLLRDIANDHLSDCNFEKACNTYKNSLIGVNQEQVNSLLLGEHVLSVDVETQTLGMVRVTGDDKPTESRIFAMCRKAYHEIADDVQTMRVIGQFASEVVQRVNGNYLSVGISFDEALQVYECAPKKQEILMRMVADIEEDLSTDTRIVQAKDGINLLKGFTKKIELQLVFLVEVNKAGLFKDDARYDLYRGSYLSLLDRFRMDFTNLEAGIPITDELFELLDDHLDAQRKIDEVVKEGIQPYDHINEPIVQAYWVSPKGVVYGLDGEISNMLHYTLASAIVNDTEVDLSLIDDGTDERDAYQELEAAGWMKISGHWALFDGNHCTFTKEQQKVLYEIASIYYIKNRKPLQIGYCTTQIAPTRIMGMDLVMLQKHFTI